MTKQKPNRNSSSGPRILVVDDDPKVHKSFVRILGNEIPVHAASGGEALEKVRVSLEEKRPFQVAFVDAGMRGMDGVETIELIWGLDSQIQTVICTADLDDCGRDLARHFGNTDRLLVLRKPFYDIEVTQLVSTLAHKCHLGTHLASASSPAPANTADAAFLQQVTDAVETSLADDEFDVEKLSHLLGMSRRQFFRKFKAAAGCTPNIFIRDLRLKRAAKLLEESTLTISEVIYAVGFSDPKHFRVVFKERFGVLPGGFVKKTSA